MERNTGTMPETPLTSRRAGPLGGEAAVPGDKSISHRALIVGASAIGETRISGLLESDDLHATAGALSALGVEASGDGGGNWRLEGRGVGGLAEPATVLDMGNSGTSARLLIGLLASHPFTSCFSGDDSLSGRPMKRVMAPLEMMGAQFKARDGGYMPLSVDGAASPVPISYELPVASAQVKSAVLLAGLNTPGLTTVFEPQPSRDHTENMLKHFGAEVAIGDIPGGGRQVALTGQPELRGQEVTVPKDISSAAFPLVAALLAPGSRVALSGVGVNPLRSGLLESLGEMGAAVGIANRRTEAGEPVCDLTAEAGPLRGTEVPPGRVPAMIDEFPILCMAAACAEGTTSMSGLKELRVKESDRLAALARGLAACGVAIEEGDDWLVVHGAGRPPRGGAEVAAGQDHRIAMAFLVLGLASEEPIAIDDGAAIATSFPGFGDLMNGLGARIEGAGP